MPISKSTLFCHTEPAYRQTGLSNVLQHEMIFVNPTDFDKLPE